MTSTSMVTAAVAARAEQVTKVDGEGDAQVRQEPEAGAEARGERLSALALSGTVPRARARGFRLRKTAHKVALTAHVLGSVGWFGVAVVVAFLGIAATVTSDPKLPVALYRAMHASLWVSIPTGAIAVGTGVVLSLGTAWGLVRHWWVVAKIAISVAVIVTDAVVISSATASAASTGSASSPLRDGTVAHCIVLAVATGLSIFKPKGRTPHGRRSLPNATGGRNVESR